MSDIQNEVITQLIEERRSEKRWKNIRFFVGVLIFVLVLGIIFTEPTGSQETYGTGGKDYVAFIRLDGMIEPGPGFSAEGVIPLLRDAFADKQAKGLIIDINSGGGTPVQAAIIHDAILDFKKKNNKKVIVVGEDLLASGAYYVAVAADKIYVNPNTITGSIGVIMKGFGFTDLIKKIGVDRRVFSAGVNKDRLDPFLPETPEDIEKIKSVISEVHDNFKQAVLDGRKGKLTATPDALFTGDFWSGQTALKLGLVDGLGSMFDVMEKEFNVTRYKDFSASNNILKNLVGQFGTSLDLALNHDRVKLMEKI